MSIVGSTDGYALKEARVDAVRFEELLADTRSALRDRDVPAAADAVASALALWRGPALQGLTGILITILILILMAYFLV